MINLDVDIYNKNELYEFLDKVYENKIKDSLNLGFATLEDRLDRFAKLVLSASTEESLAFNHLHLGAYSVSEICRFIYNHSQYTQLSLCGSYLLEDGCKSIAYLILLSESYAPKKGNLSQVGTPMDTNDTQITDHDNFQLPALSTELKTLLHPSSLTSLDLSGCHFGTYGAAYLFDALGSLTTCSITKLNLNCAEMGKIVIGSRAGKSLERFLIKNKSVTTLLMQNCNLLDAVSNLSKGLVANKIISTLDLSCNMLGNREMGILMPGFKSMSQLKDLNLSFNRIGNTGLIHFSLALKTMRLSKLDLRSNMFTAIGFSLLTDSITRLNTLRDRNRISISSHSSEESAIAYQMINVSKIIDEPNRKSIAVSVKLGSVILQLPSYLKNDMLISPSFSGCVSINLSYCGMGSHFFNELCNVLKNSKSINILKTLIVVKNDLTQDCCNSLKEFLEVSCLNNLDLSYNYINCDGMAAIAVGINKNNITHLNLKCNAIGESGGQILMQKIVNIKNVIECDIEGNRLPYSLFIGIQNSVAKNLQIFQANSSHILTKEIEFLNEQLIDIEQKELIAAKSKKELRVIEKELSIVTGAVPETESVYNKSILELEKALATLVNEKFNYSRQESAAVRDLNIDKATWASKLSFLQTKLDFEEKEINEISIKLENSKNSLRQCTTETDSVISSCSKELKTDSIQLQELQDAIKSETTKMQDFIKMLYEKAGKSYSGEEISS